jgi:putative alpha-1,2-mannosidase
MGGKQSWESRLDSTFNGNHFGMGNEPGFMIPYAYFFSGNRGKAVETVHGLLKKEFRPGRKGLPGQDDSGALSSWLIWGYLGLYPLAGTDEYWLSQPYATSAEITLAGGKSLSVSGKGKRPFLNGKEYKSLKIKHSDLLAGGKIEWKD